MSPLLTPRRNVPAPNRPRRVGPAPNRPRRVGPATNCPVAELAAPSWPRRIGCAESAAPSCPRPLAIAPCLSVCVCLSQIGVLLKQLNESSWFWHGSFLRPIYLHCKEIWIPPKIRVLPSWTLSQTLDLETWKTSMTIRSCCQHDLLTVEVVDHAFEAMMVDSGHVMSGHTQFITCQSTVVLSFHYFD